MDFLGPLPADYENARSLNLAFLELLRSREPGRRYLKGLPPGLKSRLQNLTRPEIGRVAATPFLLFSFRERDDEYWQRILTDDRSRDLFATPVSSTDDGTRLVSAGLGFVWQLAGRNPFAARILCGASTHWCEQITEQTFFHILAFAGQRTDLLVLRDGHDAELWRILLENGVSDRMENRHAARLSALHHILTRQSPITAWSAAACASRDPALKVADKSKRWKRSQ